MVVELRILLATWLQEQGRGLHARFLESVMKPIELLVVSNAEEAGVSRNVRGSAHREDCHLEQSARDLIQVS